MNFITSTEFCQLFFLKWKAHFTLSKKNMPVIQVLITSLSISHSFKQKFISLARHNHLSSRQPLYFNIQKFFMYTSHFIAKNIKKICTQGSRFNKINFYCFIKNIPKRSNERKQWLLVQSGAIILIWAKAQFYPPLLLCHWMQMCIVKQQKKDVL